MFHGDIARKQTLVDFGFRLPSALDNRPLNFEEFEEHINQVVYVSATPGPYEHEHSEQVVEQIIRPTGLSTRRSRCARRRARSTTCWTRSAARVERGERVLVTTLTKKMAEDLADYLQEMGVKTHYLHSEIDTLERVEILRDLRLGVYDVVVGINLLREGLDLPEVSLVAILDADKEGYLRSEWLADPDDRPRRPPRQRPGDHVRRQDDRLDALRDRRDRTPPPHPGGVQRGARHRARGHPQGDPRHHRPRASKVAEEKGEYNVGDICRRTSSRAWSRTSRSR